MSTEPDVSPGSTAPSNGLSLNYEVGGEGPPVVMIMGIGSQRIHWPKRFLQTVQGRGLRTITYDNRDVGRSSWLTGQRAPNPLTMLSRAMAGLTTDAPYSLADMADDLVGLLDHLNIEQAHVAGISMGGMIAQTFALRHPQRLRSLVSMHSTTGARMVSIGQPAAYKALLSAGPKSREEAVERHVQVAKVIGSKGFAIDWKGIRRRAGQSYDVGLNPAGFMRQWAAIMHSGDRTAQLAQIQVPTQVIHGTVDPLIPARAGQATAAAIPDAEIDLIAGMGHDLPPGVYDRIADGIARTVARGEDRTATR